MKLNFNRQWKMNYERFLTSIFCRTSLNRLSTDLSNEVGITNLVLFGKKLCQCLNKTINENVWRTYSDNSIVIMLCYLMCIQLERMVSV